MVPSIVVLGIQIYNIRIGSSKLIIKIIVQTMMYKFWFWT